jgi:hypothetical protein
MKKYNIKDFNNGWFIGDFEPSIWRNPFFEMAHHTHKANDPTYKHYHKVTTELNYIVSGDIIVDGNNLTTGDIWIYEANDISDVTFLTDTSLIVLRWPSIPSDKYLL